MPASITVIPELGLMLAVFTGHTKASEAVAAFEAYQNHADFAAGQKHLIDFSGVTSFEGDFTKLMELQARLLEAVHAEQQVLFVYCAPTTLTQRMAQHSVNAWKTTTKIVTRILETEIAAMEVIGLPHLRFADLIKQEA